MSSVVLGLSLAAFTLAACNDDGPESASAGTCKNSMELVERVSPAIGGELAAFTLVQKPMKLPLLSFSDREGKPASTRDFEGKTVLFNLWATWCAPCRVEMPAFDRLEAEFGGEDFAVVPVSVDRGGPEKPLAFYNEIGLKHLPFFQDETMGVFNTLKKEGLAFGLPVTVLLDREGCILGSLNGPAEWAGEDAVELVRIAMGETE